MISKLKLNLSPGAKLIALAIVAVMLPTTVLSVIQYRSLVDLEAKTKVAVQENLRQTLHSVSRKVKEKFKALAREALGPIDMRDVERGDCEKIERHFATIRELHPEIDRLFAVSYCSTPYYALLFTPEGAIRLEESKFKDSIDYQRIYSSWKRAYLSRASMNLKQDFIFDYAPRAVVPGKATYQPQAYIFQPLFKPGNDDPFGFAGIALCPVYVREHLFPEVIPQLLSNPDIGVKNSEVALGILDENNKEIYTSKAGLNYYEVKIPFSPVFPKWELGIGYRDTTIEALAKDNFQKNLMLSLFVLSLLIVGIILTLRATAREIRLAQAKSTFVSNVSHELKTPLALIRLFAETLELGRVRSPEKAQEYYRIINSESRRLTQLINNILDFAKIEAGRKEYQFVDADVAEVVEEVIRSYEYQIINAGFELKTDIQRDLPLISIDRDAISQAVLNLLNNAVKYSDDVKKIAVRVRSHDRYISIEVADSGIGIPRSEHEKIFEKFYRVSTGLIHNTKGSGLGLALVKHIVEAHRGRILLESAPGKGSRFTILLPMNGAEVAPNKLSFDSGGYKVAESSNN